jgi:hypothetical protein
MKRQLDDALLQLKSLQKIIELLQQDNGDSRILNHEETADKCGTVTEDLDLFCDAKHRENCNVSPVTVALPPSVPVLDSKFIAQADSLSKWSDVVACKRRCGHQSVSQVKSAAIYNIPTIINGQVLSTDKLTIQQKTMTPVFNRNVTNDQYKDHKVLLLSDNQGRGCAERIKKSITL